MILSSAKYMLESYRDIFSFYDIAVFKYRFISVYSYSYSELNEF
jgi:hypothetical protein